MYCTNLQKDDWNTRIQYINTIYTYSICTCMYSLVCTPSSYYLVECRLGFWTGLFVGIQKLAGAELDEKQENQNLKLHTQLKKERTEGRKDGKESSKNKKTTELGLS